MQQPRKRIISGGSLGGEVSMKVIDLPSYGLGSDFDAPLPPVKPGGCEVARVVCSSLRTGGAPRTKGEARR